MSVHDDQKHLFSPGGGDDSGGGGRMAMPDLWIEHAGPESDVAVSTRLRLARNVEGFHFKSRFSDGEGERLEVYLREVLKELEPDLRYLTLNDLSTAERDVMFERQLVSREHVKETHPRGVAFSGDGTVSVMVNEEDHLRIAVFAPGLDLDAVRARAMALDDNLAGQLEYSFTSRYGFLTSCPTNTGTGMRVSVMLHLPALGFRPPSGRRRRSAEIARVHNAARDMDLTVRGLHGESSRADGDFYQISNQVTLGRTVAETIKAVAQLTDAVINWERKSRRLHMRHNRALLEDHIWRAWALLSHARRLSSGEALGHISAVRLGVALGLITDVDLGTLQRLMVVMRPGHLQWGVEDKLGPEARDEVRAELVRATLSRTPPAG